MYNRENFNKIAKPWIKYGLIKELFSTDDYSLCNVANYMYLLVYDVSEKHGLGGIIVEPENVRKLFNNSNFFKKILKHYYANDLIEESSTYLNRDTYGNIVNMKKETDLNGPSELIDLEFEEMLTKIRE